MQQQQTSSSGENKTRFYGQPVESFSNDVSVDRRIKEACSIGGGELQPQFQRLFLELGDKDKLSVADFVIASYHENNITAGTKRVYIVSLVYLSRYLNRKSFVDMTSHDIIEGYLNSLKRPIEADPDQKWISTFNVRATVISKFFKWITQPDLPANERKLASVPMLKGLKFQKKKGPRSRVKPTDLWTIEEDALFIKYCEDPRIACYHSMARDTSARPGELLAVKIGDIKIKKAAAVPGTKKSKMFAEVEIGRYGKRKKTRIVPLINSLPYLKAWLAQHPMGQNPNAYLFVSLENSARYRNVPLKSSSLSGLYRGLRIYHFPTKIL